MTASKTFAGIAAAFLFAASPAQAAPVQLTWTSTVSSIGDDLPPGVALGDSFTFTLTVDNGAASVASQTWGLAALVSASLNVDAGDYVVTMTGGAVGASSFQTDAGGNVTAVGNWQAFPTVDYADSAGNDDGNSGIAGWFINGNNQVFGMFDPFSSPGSSLIAISSPTVSDNQNPASWQAALVGGTVPEPATLALVLAALGLAVGLRRRAPVR